MIRIVPHTWRSHKIVTPWHQIRYLHTWHIFNSKQIIKIHLGNVFIVRLCYDQINPAIKIMITPLIYMTSLFQSSCRPPGNYLLCVYCHKIICGRQVTFRSSWLVPSCWQWFCCYYIYAFIHPLLSGPWRKVVMSCDSFNLLRYKCTVLYYTQVSSKCSYKNNYYPFLLIQL